MLHGNHHRSGGALLSKHITRLKQHQHQSCTQWRPACQPKLQNKDCKTSHKSWDAIDFLRGNWTNYKSFFLSSLFFGFYEHHQKEFWALKPEALEQLPFGYIQLLTSVPTHMPNHTKGPFRAFSCSPCCVLSYMDLSCFSLPVATLPSGPAKGQPAGPPQGTGKCLQSGFSPHTCPE